ncbi:MAG: sialidase family protein [Acidimicrobiales bacterium]
MKFRKSQVGAAATAIGAMLLAFGSSAFAEPGPTPYTYKQVTYKDQGQKFDLLTSSKQMTKEFEPPARAFGSPTAMAVHPDNPRIVVAASIEMRTRTCYLIVSKDAGQTWRFSKELPAPKDYQYCLNGTAGVPEANLAFGRDGMLYYVRQAYGDGEGPRDGKSSALLARTSNLGESWQFTLVKNNRNAPAPPGNVSSVTGLAVDTSGPRDIVYVGYSESFPDAPTDSPLRAAPNVMVATSTDGGATFGTPVNLNSLQRPSLEIAGKKYELVFRSGFGAPFLFAHDGVLLAVAGPDLPAADRPQPPPEAGQGLNPGSWYAYPMPQLMARSTDQGKTFTINPLGDPILAGTGSYTGMGWTPEGGPRGTMIAVYAATPATSQTIALADIVMQRSTDSGVTWSSPLALDDDKPEAHITGFYPQVSVAPNGRIDVAWQDNRETTDYLFDVRYTYSTDGGLTWAKNVKVNDKPLDFNYGISYNSDYRYPVGVGSANSYAIIGWADSRLATDLTQTQDSFASAVQFEPLPTTKNTTAPYIAAVFGGLVVAGLVLLGALQFRKLRGSAPGGGSSRRTSRVPVGA